MKVIKLKTNIMCSSCVAKVTPELNRVAGENNWKVDVQDPGKTLTVSGVEIAEKDVVNAIEKAGFRAVSGL